MVKDSFSSMSMLTYHRIFFPEVKVVGSTLNPHLGHRCLVYSSGMSRSDRGNCRHFWRVRLSTLTNFFDSAATAWLPNHTKNYIIVKQPDISVKVALYPLLPSWQKVCYLQQLHQVFSLLYELTEYVVVLDVFPAMAGVIFQFSYVISFHFHLKTGSDSRSENVV